MLLLLSLLALTSTGLLLRAEARGLRRHVYVFKPLTTTLILVLALTMPSPVSSAYQIAVVLGLIFSLAGDVFLMLPSDRFVAGLASFLVAHLCYIAAFFPAAGAMFSLWVLLPFLVYGALLLRMLWPHLGRLAGPVLLYAATLLVMGWQAAEQHLALHTAGTLAALLGAVFFVVSDSLLAFKRFVRPFQAAQYAVLTTYFAAQWLIALSVGG
jgi:uncharacterized membrane protein YhhN